MNKREHFDYDIVVFNGSYYFVEGSDYQLSGFDECIVFRGLFEDCVKKAEELNDND